MLGKDRTECIWGTRWREIFLLIWTSAFIMQKLPTMIYQ